MRDDLIVGCRAGQPLQPAQLALGFLADIVGQVGFLEPLSQGGDFGLFRSLFAELFLNRAELLAEHVFALVLRQLALDLAGDFLTQLEHLRFMIEEIEQQA